MPYIGTPPSDRIITSEDIEAGAVEMSDISWKNQPANENISGTIDSFTVKLAEQFTLIGDIDISKDLVLTKLADDGEALVLTTDASSRTIEGSGTISSNTFAQVPNAKLEGMTGVLDSTVQDNITRLGTVTSGTIGSAVINNAGVASGTIGSDVINNAGVASGTIGSNVALSFGQEQQNLTSSRAINTTYTNSTNKPIFVAVTMTTGTSSDSRWEVGGVTNPGGVYTNSSNGRNNLSTVVPSGDTYKLVVNGNGTLSGWMEVR